MDGDGERTRKVKIEAPTFDGVHNLLVFSDCVADMNYYFNW